jgi:hypothetical protein
VQSLHLFTINGRLVCSASFTDKIAALVIPDDGAPSTAVWQAMPLHRTRRKCAVHRLGHADSGTVLCSTISIPDNGDESDRHTGRHVFAGGTSGVLTVRQLSEYVSRTQFAAAVAMAQGKAKQSKA